MAPADPADRRFIPSEVLYSLKSGGIRAYLHRFYLVPDGAGQTHFSPKLLTSIAGTLTFTLGLASRGDGVRFGVSVAQNFLEVDEIGLLLRVELEIADLPISLGRRSCLEGRDSGDVLDVVEDLGRRKQRRVAGRRAR